MCPEQLTHFKIDGTTSVKNIILANEGSLIAIENISMYSDVTYLHQPTDINEPQDGVITSLERSLNENADIWEELSKL